jgi:prepilin-type processing-associated H-X9-DG protein
MFRYASPVPDSFDPSGGPYNLGLVWYKKYVTDGKVYYCPSFRPAPADPLFDQDRVHERYEAKGIWPFGAGTPALDKNTVRSGYSYLPQLIQLTNLTTALGSKQCGGLPGGGDYQNTTTATEKKWICLEPIKGNQVDTKRSMIMDTLADEGVEHLSHKTSKGQPAGLNAGFGDGHVRWQKYNANAEMFNTNLWDGVVANQGDNLRYIVHLLEP